MDDFDPATVSWVLTDQDLGRFKAAIGMCEEVVLDLETSGLAEHAWSGGPQNGGYPARIVLASATLPSLGDPHLRPTTWVLPLSHPDSPWLGRWRKTLRDVLTELVRTGRPVINQHVKFDAKWVRAQCGVDISHLIVWDTMVSSHLLDENASTRLKERAPATFDVPRWDDFDLSTPGAAERVPMFDLGMYAARDTYWTWRLAELHRQQMFLGEYAANEPDSADEVETARLGKLAVWCAMPMISTLTAIEQRGMQLDRDWTERELAEHHAAAAELTEELSNRYPHLDVDGEAAVSFAPTSHYFRDWSAEAVARGDLVVAELTPNGKPRWSKGVLVRQARTGSEVAAKLLDLKGHVKKAEFLTSWLHHATRDDMIHTTYHAGRVVTGRLSSEGPNMQQVTATLKPAFVPPPGHVFIDLDYSQIELRVAAYISRCEPMLEAFRQGADLHRMLAANITGKSLADVLPPERQAGKSANFGLLYGMGIYGFREYAETVYGVVFTIEEAAHIHRAFFATWDGIAQWHARTVRRAHQTGQVTSPIGRVRRVPGIWDGNDAVALAAERVAINAPVQGFASDLMQMAAASIEGRLPGHEPVPDARIVATVHDDIVVIAPDTRWKEVTVGCQERMTGIGSALRKLDCVLDVPLAAEAKVGTRWGWSDVGVVA